MVQSEGAGWSGRPLSELTESELAELAERLAAERPENDPMLIAVRDLWRNRRADEGHTDPA